MEQLIWNPPNEGLMRYSSRATSRGRFWSGISATLFDTTGGVAEVPMFAKHYLSMHVGTPVLATCRCSGAVLRHYQVPGDIDVIPAGFAASREDRGPTTMLVVNVSPPLVSTAAEGMGIDPDRVSIEPRLQIRDPKVEHIGWALKAELESDEPFGHLYADSLGLALAAHLVRCSRRPAAPRTTNGLPKRRLLRVLEYVNENLAENLTLATLAEVANLSPSHFKMLFKQSVGLPVHQFVIRRRVDFAVDLLLRGKTRARDVALRAGFANQSHMARWMRRITGMTPGGLTHDA